VVLRSLADLILRHYQHHEYPGYLGWRRKWSGSKRRQIDASVRDDRPRPELVDLMVKREAHHDPPSRPRGIQMYRNMATQALFGYVFYALQHAVCDVFRERDVGGGVDITIACGMNALDLGAWMDRVVRRGARGFYERDGRNWDATMARHHHLLKMCLYRHINPDFARFVEACYRVRGAHLGPHGWLRYSVEGTVKSGHNDTTLGNSIVNAFIAAEALWAARVRGSILVMGDDLIIALYDEVPLEVLVAIEARFGIVPIARMFFSPFDVSFISGVWFPHGSGYAFAPKPGRLFARLFWTVHPPAPRRMEPYLRGVCRGLRPTCGGLPLVRELLRAFDTPGEADVVRDKSTPYAEVDVSWGDLFEHFASRYHVSVRDLHDCEAWLRLLEPGPALLVHPVLDALMRVDLADAPTRPTMGSSSTRFILYSF